MNKFIKLISAAVVALGLATSANAGVIFADDFNSENGGVGQLNYNGFVNWGVTNGTVDLIGNGFYDFFPSNGLYVDLDGSSSDAGLMGRFQQLNTGDYTLSFDLAGNQRNNAAELTTVNVAIVLGDGVSANDSYALNKSDGFQTYSLDFSVGSLINPAFVYISFGAAGGDNIGMLLDNVVLADRVLAVAEPMSALLFGLGLLGFGATRRKTK